jgi:hypothetical protein
MAIDPDDIDQNLKDYEKQVRAYRSYAPSFSSDLGTTGGEEIALTEAEVAEKLKGRRQQMESDPLRAQRLLLKDFEGRAPEMQRQAIEGVAGQERRRLAGELTGIKSGASSRGLLYSGMRQGAEAKARAGSDVNMAEQRQGINQAFNQQRQALKEAPIKSGLNMAQMQSGVADQVMSQALSNMQQRQQSMSGLGSALGAIGGAYFGSKSPASGGDKNFTKYGQNREQ